MSLGLARWVWMKPQVEARFLEAVRSGTLALSRGATGTAQGGREGGWSQRVLPEAGEPLATGRYWQ